MRHRGIGIFVAFVHMDRLLVIADKALIGQDTALGVRRGDHFTGERRERVEAARPDGQFDPPGNLHSSSRRGRCHATADLTGRLPLENLVTRSKIDPRLFAARPDMPSRPQP